MIQNKTLGIFTRIPLYVLGEALKDHLTGFDVTEEHLTQLLEADYAGWKTKHFAATHIISAVKNSPLTPFLEEHKTEILDALNNNSDRSLILTAVICGRYHFAYQLAKIFAKQFRQQDVISTKLLHSLVADIYGMNVSTKNTLNSVVPQMIEAGIIKRDKPGQFEPTEAIAPNHQVTIDLWKEAFFANEPLCDRDDEESYIFEPFFRYIKFV